ncbi:MAG: CHASE2 domain-containing protein [Gammaproteobacteria bacterium]|nr:CHASE2 domain-containing protein [Gammaproteobacteria bacterium]
MTSLVNGILACLFIVTVLISCGSNDDKYFAFKEVRVVNIDEQSVNELGGLPLQGRKVHRLLTRILRYNPAVIAVATPNFTDYDYAIYGEVAYKTAEEKERERNSSLYYRRVKIDNGLEDLGREYANQLVVFSLSSKSEMISHCPLFKKEFNICGSSKIDFGSNGVQSVSYSEYHHNDFYDLIADKYFTFHNNMADETRQPSSRNYIGIKNQTLKLEYDESIKSVPVDSAYDVLTEEGWENYQGKIILLSTSGDMPLYPTPLGVLNNTQFMLTVIQNRLNMH